MDSKQIQAKVESLIGKRSELLVLEAGCGKKRHLTFGPAEYVVGIDPLSESLDKNEKLHERIVGDIQEYRFQSSKFDVVICFDVLEHLPNPEKALLNLVDATRDGGLIVLKAPNPHSIQGLVTKFTPHRFHVWWYRYILGAKNAGRQGYSPYPTFMRSTISVPVLRRFAASNMLKEEFVALYEGAVPKSLKRKAPLLYQGYWTLAWLLRLLSFGRYRGEFSDYVGIWRKGSENSAQQALTERFGPRAGQANSAEPMK